jgi:hypothetical protein
VLISTGTNTITAIAAIAPLATRQMSRVFIVSFFRFLVICGTSC